MTEWIILTAAQNALLTALNDRVGRLGGGIAIQGRIIDHPGAPAVVRGRYAVPASVLDGLDYAGRWASRVVAIPTRQAEASDLFAPPPGPAHAAPDPGAS